MRGKTHGFSECGMIKIHSDYIHALIAGSDRVVSARGLKLYLRIFVSEFFSVIFMTS